MTKAATAPRVTQGSVAVDGVRFHLLRAEPTRKRKTTPTLLLHGVPETSACWRDLMPELARDRVVIAPDLKGLGSSEAREPYDVATLSAELAALILHEVDGPVDIVGHDWGGSIALALAGRRPDLVRRLVVVSAPFRKVNLVAAWHIPLFWLPVLPETAFRLAGDQIVRRMFDYAWRGSEPLPADVLDGYVAAYTPSDRVSAMLAYYRAAITSRVRASLAPLGVGGATTEGETPRVNVERSLVVWGTADPSLPLSVGESVVTDLGAGTTMLTLPGVGHWPVEEAPDVVIPAIADFLRAP